MNYPLQISIDDMRVLLALMLSAIFHISMVWLWPYHAVPRQKNHSVPSILQVRIQQKSQVSTIGEMPILMGSISSFQSTSRPIKTSTHRNINLSKVVKQYSEYLSTSELERKALPISNIDSSMFKDIFLSGMPVRLRLYINASGKVVNIVRKSNLDQDDEMISHLESLLYQMTFIPARKNEVDVNSYQDIEFNFNPLANTSSDLQDAQ